MSYNRTLESGEGAVLGKLDLLELNRLTGLVAPVNDTDATTKLYVDALVAEGVKPIAPVKAATTANTALSGLLEIDGITLTNGQRVLVKNQATASQNGIYTASATAWTKVTVESVKGSLVFVEGGTVNNDSKFYAQDDTTWILFSRTDTITASGGLQKVGVDISVASLGITNAMIAANTIVLLNKTAAFTSLDNAATAYDTWAELTAANTSENIDVKLKNLYAAIGLLRGTANYNTNNTETIAGAFDLAEVKNRTFTFTTATPETGPGQQFAGQTFVTGDLYFQELTT
jgi:phage-related tail fiber protein